MLRTYCIGYYHSVAQLTSVLQSFVAVGWVTWFVIIVPEMTYNVSSETLGCKTYASSLLTPPQPTTVTLSVVLCVATYRQKSILGFRSCKNTRTQCNANARVGQ